jgi:O-antigen/teichoic acid export membrane protein
MFSQKLALSYGSKLIVQMIQMATSLIVARLVGPSVLGVLAYGLAFVSMFSFIVDMGTGTAYVKLITDGNDQKAILGTFLRIKLSLILLFIFVVISSLLYSKSGSLSNISLNLQDKVILIYLVITVMSFLYSIQTTHWTSLMQQAKVDLPQLLQQIVYQLLRLAAAFAGYKALGIVISNFIACLVVLPLYLWMGKGLSIGKFEKSIAILFLKISFPVILIGIFQVLIYSTDKVLLKHFTDVRELGYYSASFTIASFMRGIESSVGILFFPFITTYLKESKIDKVSNIIARFESFSLTFIVPFTILFVIMSDKVILLAYGNEFLPAVKPLSLLLLTFTVSLFLLPYGNIILGKGKFYLAAIIWAAAFFVYILTAFFLTSPAYLNLQGQGMAIALLISNLFLGLVFVLETKKIEKEIKVLPGLKVLLFNLIVAIIFGSIYYYFIADNNFLWSVAFAVCYILFFYLSGYFLKVFGMDQLYLLKNILSIRKLKLYIREELLPKK